MCGLCATGSGYAPPSSCQMLWLRVGQVNEGLGVAAVSDRLLVKTRDYTRSIVSKRTAVMEQVSCPQYSFEKASARFWNHKSAELPQLPANHRDRPSWERVHAVGRGGDRDVLILSRGVAILHKSYRSDE